MDIYFFHLYNTENLSRIELHKLQHNEGRKHLKYLLEKVYNIDCDILEKDGKPYLKNNEIYFSISHSKELICICFDKSEIGVDIEFEKERDYKKILKHYNITDENISQQEFYKMWTIYEAEYKSTIKSDLICFEYENFMCAVSYKTASEIRVFEDLNLIQNPEFLPLPKERLIS